MNVRNLDSNAMWLLTADLQGFKYLGGFVNSDDGPIPLLTYIASLICTYPLVRNKNYCAPCARCNNSYCAPEPEIV